MKKIEEFKLCKITVKNGVAMLCDPNGNELPAQGSLTILQTPEDLGYVKVTIELLATMPDSKPLLI